MEDVYSSINFISISALEKLGGNFSALGFLWVLRDVLAGKTEGIVNLKALASSLNVSMSDVYSYIGVLEDSFVIATRAETDGRRVKILTVPAVQEASSASPGCSDFITDYLRRHDVIPGKSKTGQTSSIVTSTALHLGNNFQAIKSFYAAVKATLNDRHTFTYSLNDANIPMTDTNRITSFANGLKNAGFLSSYSYKKAPQRTITAQVANTSEAIRFISGGWLEEWIYCRAVQLLTGGYACVRNLNVMLPGGDVSEFDLMICRGENLFWIEAKTAGYSSFVQKYSRTAGTLGLPPARAFLVSPSAPLNEIHGGMTCCNLEGFPQAFGASLKACTS